MARDALADEQIGRLHRKFNDLVHNLGARGTLSFDEIERGLQAIHDRKAVVRNIRDLFSCNGEMMHRNIGNWGTKLHWNFTPDDHRRANRGMDLVYTVNPFHHLVLVPYQETVQETVDQLTRALSLAHEGTFEVRDPLYFHKVALIEGAEHPGRCLRWELIDLSANWGRSDRVSEVADASKSAHAGVLAAAAHFSLWARQLNGTLSATSRNVPPVWVGGFRLLRRDAPESAWGMELKTEGDMLQLCASPYNTSIFGASMPEFVTY